MNIANQDKRVHDIQEWLMAVLPYSDFDLSTASADASFRRYFRVNQKQSSWIVMDAPPEHEDIEPFVKVAEFLAQFGIHVPKIYAKSLQHGFLLLSDLGDTSFLSVLNPESADLLYANAIDEIIKMQLAPTTAIDLPLYNADLLNTEMNLFPEWFLKRHLNLEPPACLDNIFKLLIDNAQTQNQFFVHRDYHSRNLMLVDEQNVGVIDFQDAVIGPASYDLVSLLRDVYIEWPEDKVDSWLENYFAKAQQNNLLDCEKETFTRWFDLMGLQRHLKILGIFCRLAYRDNKPRYLKDLPLTLRYVLQVTERYPELNALHAYLTKTSDIMAIK
ncbi:aminoglycoside phosphotransferase family protein [Methylophaga sp.]|uniref:aminoglycoside phosphotransferase family protein n=1 Tax=Methylophaga sp. TaxID=2024840 RepID=UPI003F69F8DB